MKSRKRGRSINQAEEKTLSLAVSISLPTAKYTRAHSPCSGPAPCTSAKLAWVLLPTNSSSITLSSYARASLETVTKALAPVRLGCTSMSQVSSICCTSTLSPLSSSSKPSPLNPQPKALVCNPPSHSPFLRLKPHPLSHKP